MSSISSSALRLFLPKPLPAPFGFPSKNSSRSLLFFSPISFQPLPKSSILAPPLRAQQPQQEQESSVDVSALPPKLRDIISLFQSVPDAKARYQQLLHYGGRLPPLDPVFKTDEHRVRGCVSQVWVRAFVDPDDPSAVRFEADSDSVLTKGLAALLVFGLSGSPASVIARVPPDFVHLLGLRKSLTPSRNNGFLNMLKLMQQTALQLDADATESEKRGTFGFNVLSKYTKGEISSLDAEADKISRNSVSEVNGNGTSSPIYPVTVSEESSKENGDDNVVNSASPDGKTGGRRKRIIEKLERELSPLELEVEDVSHLHAGHSGVRASTGGETHFNVKVVSKEFEGKSLVKRHRLIYQLLQEEMQSGLHALSIDAKTPLEVQSS